MRERQRLATVGYKYTAKRVGDAGTLTADNIRPHYGDERLNIDHHQVSL
jgi:hypothetical protein